jgi:hypothetical protein
LHDFTKNFFKQNKTPETAPADQGLFFVRPPVGTAKLPFGQGSAGRFVQLVNPHPEALR